MKAKVKGRMLKQSLNNYGYLTVFLMKDGKGKTCYIHRLVAETFIQNIENKPQVNHIDGNKKNNCVNNLEFCTLKCNVQHAWNTGLCEAVRNNFKLHHSKNAHRSKKKVIQYNLNGDFIKKWQGMTDAGKQLNILVSSISDCCKGRYKTAGGYKWKYDNEKNC